MSSGVGIVTSGKVSVVRSNNRVLLSLWNVLSVPLTDTWSASVGEDDTADTLESVNHAISSNGGSDLLGSGSDGETGFGLETV